MYVLNHYVDEAFSTKGWSVREVHGIDPDDKAMGGWEMVPIANYQAHLDYVKTKVDSGDLWVEGGWTEFCLLVYHGNKSDLHDSGYRRTSAAKLADYRHVRRGRLGGHDSRCHH